MNYVIDRMSRRSTPGLCELCEKRLATRKVRFNAQYVQSASMAIFDEESLVGDDFERRVCEECYSSLQNAKNVTNLTFEQL